jgi:Histidine kinase-, DNA gyrase B-, and HSP90-like ATPase
MTLELKVHPSFFREFATKTWISPNEIIKELIENAFDEDATKILVTILKDGSVVIEDDAGMDQNDMEKFLLLGSTHKKIDHISPKMKRIRTGRYGTGRLSFLTSFESMKIKTKHEQFSKSIVIDVNTIDNLFTGNTKLQELNEARLDRNGTELTMRGPKVTIDIFRLSREIRKLPILRQPMFEVYIKNVDNFTEWNFDGAQLISAPEIQGHKISVNLDDDKIIGEIVIARRPLSEDEKGIAVLIGNHVVIRTNFGFDSKLSRVTGYVRCDTLTSRFADKSALIEDKEYEKFNQTMKTFVIDTILPSLNEYEDVLITREESKIYKEIDKVLGQAVIENLETQEEVQGYELIDMEERNTKEEPLSFVKPTEISSTMLSTQQQGQEISETNENSRPIQDYNNVNPMISNKNSIDLSSTNYMQHDQQTISQTESAQQMVKQIAKDDPQNEFAEVIEEKGGSGTLIRTRKVRKSILKKTFALKKIGYKVIPYEDESDSRYSFTTENVVFVNKANSTYRAEASRGDEFLLRHIISIVAETIAETKHPEGKDALELQNRLVAEAIRIHDYSIMKK